MSTKVVQIDPVTQTGTNGRPSQPGWRGVTSVDKNFKPHTSHTSQPKKSSGVGTAVGSALAGVPGALVGGAIDVGLSAISGEISAKRNEEYNIRAEDRADKRNRQMLLDQPLLTAEGRRKAGLNPYGDAVLPGMVAQSSVDTSAGSNLGNTFGQMLQKERLQLDEAIAIQQLENETLLAKSQANKNDADAERSRGLEGRDVDSFDLQMQKLIEDIQGSAIANDISRLDLIIKQYTMPNEMALSDVELQSARNDITQQIYNIMLTDVSIDEKRAVISNLKHQDAYLVAQTELARAGVSLTYAQVEQVWSTIANTDADTLLKYAQTDVEREALREVKARIDKIEAETKEIPANARVARNAQRFDNVWGGFNSLANLGTSAARLIGAIATGGVSEVGANLVMPSRGAFSSSQVPRDLRTPAGLIIPK